MQLTSLEFKLLKYSDSAGSKSEIWIRPNSNLKVRFGFGRLLIKTDYMYFPEQKN